MLMRNLRNWVLASAWKKLLKIRLKMVSNNFYGKMSFILGPVLYLIYLFAISDDIDLELRLARFEHLMERRLLLLNSVLLRQNPHNVQEWHKRVMLYEGQPHEVNLSNFLFNILYIASVHLLIDLFLIYRSSTPILKLCKLFNRNWP